MVHQSKIRASLVIAVQILKIKAPTGTVPLKRRKHCAPGGNEPQQPELVREVFVDGTLF
jgi:hypothetical protein